MPNMQAQVRRHNDRISREDTPEVVDLCNCTQFECPLNGRCQMTNVVYQATVTNTDDGHEETYIGATTHFKTRFWKQRTDMNNINYRSKGTTLSSYIWKLKEKKNFILKWRIVDRARSTLQSPDKKVQFMQQIKI